MEDYIDIHSHILPNIDDGSKSMEQTKRMLKIAYKEGIRTIISTPHYNDGRRETFNIQILESIESVQEEISMRMPEMRIHLGCEIFYSHDSIKMLKDKHIPTMAGSRYVLVEFSPVAEYRYIKNALQEFILEGYYPILAHVERYTNVVKQIGLVRELTEMGVYIQMNARSLTGGSGRACKRLSKKLMKNNLIHFIGTDSHSDKGRTPVLARCIKFIIKKYGEPYVKELLVDNPSRILENVKVNINGT